MGKIIGVLLFLGIVGISGFYVLKNYFPNLVPPSKDIKQFLPLNESTGSPIKVPAGTRLDVYADLRGELPRALAVDDKGILFAALTNVGKVVALPDFDRNNKPERTVEVLTGLKKPEAIAFDGRYIYIVEANKVSRYEYDKETITANSRRELFDIPSAPKDRVRNIKIDGSKINVSDGESVYTSELDGTAFNVITDKGATSDYKPLGQTTDSNGNILISTNYQVIKLKTFAGSVNGEEEFITGFVQGTNEILGRPTGLVFNNDKSLFIADDKSGLIYILTK